MGLQSFERRLERLVETAFAKTFRGSVQPVELAKRLAREMDLHRTVGMHGMIAPNYFVVAVSPADYQRFEPVRESMTRELCETVRDHGRKEKYHFLGPVEVSIEKDKNLKTGIFLVSAEMKESDGGAVGSIVNDSGDRVNIGEEPVTIGRLAECEVVLTDPNVSRRHAEIRRRGNDFFVIDLGSTNGTKVNGMGVRERRLEDGDVITVGSTRLRFETS